MILTVAIAAAGQTATPSPTPSSTTKPADTKDTDTEKAVKPKKEKRGSLILAPIPIKSPTFGSGIILGVGYVFKLKQSDKLSKPSSIGFAAAFTNNGTRGFVLGGHLSFAENKYQTTLALGTGKANYEFYGIGSVPGQPAVSTLIKQSGTFFFGEFMRNVWKDIFIGPRYQYRKLTASAGGTPTPGGFVIPAVDLKSTTAAIGFHVQRDLRDNSFYPTKGSIWDFKGDFFAKALGSNRTYQTYKASYNGYKSIGKDQVLAYRGMACSVSDTTPFFDLCLYGGSDLRGYATGQFQDRRMFATQVEYRRELIWRLGFVAFGGVGGVAKHWSDFRFNELLPAGGAGVRFKLDKKNHINYRIDWGYGRAGYTLSMSVTEAF
ncbi:MAG TPA: BamA/TamA family outer membrane protein [Pyrinomonadaceae bacterium]|nr:BamA/TamA family outer membrane protein [Pyrinomonadaceae bacterium]